jgi:diguanylate cyclase (GGDEF)-like protein
MRREMKAVAAARQWWAARRPSAESRSNGTTLGTSSVRPLSAHIARGSSFSLVLLAGAMIACAAIGFAETRYSDLRLQSEQHAALQRALDEMRAVFGDVGQFDYGQIQLIERRSGLQGLRFETDPAPDSGREIQSLQNAQGRILGWFSWTPDRALIKAMNLLWGLVGLAGVALVLCATIAGRATQRLAHSLAHSTETTRKLTSEDTLTGLANQRVMVESLDRMLSRRGAGKVAFALLDLDGFHEVNDTVGHQGGDAVLLTIVERFQAVLPAGALLGRFEDDEFAVIASGDDADTAFMLIGVLRAALSDPIVAGQPWQLTAGIGVAQAPEDGATGEQLVRRAGLALRAAKRDGRGAARRFEPYIELENSDRRFVLRELKTAVSLQTFDVHYQPIVAADGSGTVGVEALLRWTHPKRGSIAPSVFIPLAEENGLMSELGEFVLRRALADAMRWPGVFVAVNLSPVQIRDPHLVDLVGAVMAETGIAPSRVVLEMTEGILIDDPDETQARLEALQALGVSIALDDFGAGFSSLSYLQKFPFQRLKIDRAFVASLGVVGNAAAIIHSIVTLGHALGMSVLAEGIETDEQRVLLRLAGCDEMQGFLFAKPCPAKAIDALLAGHAGHEALPQAATARHGRHGCLLTHAPAAAIY